MQEKKQTKRAYYLKNLALCALFTALIISGAFIRIPVPVIPFTMQFFFTALAGMLLGAKWGFASAAMYLFLGLVGLPIFTAGGGIAYVFQPTFGYLIGFLFSTALTGAIARKGGKTPSYKRLFAACFSGLVVLYAMGTIYYWLISALYFNTQIGVWTLFLSCVLMPLTGDLVTGALAVLIAKRMIPILSPLRQKSVKTALTQEEIEKEPLSPL